MPITAAAGELESDSLCGFACRVSWKLSKTGVTPQRFTNNANEMIVPSRESISTRLELFRCFPCGPIFDLKRGVFHPKLNFNVSGWMKSECIRNRGYRVICSENIPRNNFVQCRLVLLLPKSHQMEFDPAIRSGRRAAPSGLLRGREPRSALG